MTTVSCHRFLRLSDNTVNTSLKKVYGPPGTGKTTWLIDYMKESKIPYERIAFVSFTKSTIKNLTSRLDLNKEQSQYFKTIHAMNFHLLGLQSSKLANNHLHKFPAKFSAEFLDKEMKKKEESVTVGHDAVDDDFYNQMMYERSQLLPRDYVPPQYSHVAGLYLSFKNRYFRWLEENDYIDFIGMLERGIAEEKVPPVDLLCVDEWQDLSPLQVKQVTFWSQHIPQSVHAGDDDQTIHAWAGARHRDFIEFPTFAPNENRTIILNKTYRLPTRVLDMSTLFIKRNQDRVEKEFGSAKSTAGHIEYTNIDKIADVLKEQLKHGTCKVLVRNHALVRHITAKLIERGVPVSNALAKVVRAISIIMETKDSLSVEDLYFIADTSVFPAKEFFERGGKKGLKELADMLAQSGESSIKLTDLLQYKVKDSFIDAVERRDVTKLRDTNIERALRVYEQFGRDFKTVEITTIHQSKGTEADTVVVALDVVKRTYQESRLPDKIEEERRVWYVAMTRTKKNLYFLQPTFRGFYPSPLTDYVRLFLQNETNS